MQHRFLDVPMPPPKQRGRKRDEIYGALAELPVGRGALEVQGGFKSVLQYVYRYRVEHGRQMSFRVRDVGGGRVRIWRVA